MPQFRDEAEAAAFQRLQELGLTRLGRVERRIFAALMESSYNIHGLIWSVYGETPKRSKEYATKRGAVQRALTNLRRKGAPIKPSFQFGWHVLGDVELTRKLMLRQGARSTENPPSQAVIREWKKLGNSSDEPGEHAWRWALNTDEGKAFLRERRPNEQYDWLTVFLQEFGVTWEQLLA